MKTKKMKCGGKIKAMKSGGQVKRGKPGGVSSMDMKKMGRNLARAKAQR